MKRKTFSGLFGVVVLMTMLLGLTGCSQPATTPSAPSAPTSTGQSSTVQVVQVPATPSGQTAVPPTSTVTATQSSQASGTRTVTDLAGRSVTVPDQVNRILAVHPVATYLLYQLAPEKVVSVDTVFQARYLGDKALRSYSDADMKRLASLPVTGVFFKGVDPEQLLKLKPDVVVTIVRHPQLKDFAAQLRVPVVTFAKDSLPLYAQSMRLLGTIVGNETEANKLADYWETTIQAVTSETAKTPSDKKLKVYYANSGILTTPGPGSIMASIIDLAGGINVAKSLTELNNENIEVSLEQVLQWDPEVIFVGTKTDQQKIMSDAGWKDVNAVKNNRVYVRSRYANTDGIEALMGLLWAQGKLLHANDTAYDGYFAQKMSEFYALFFKYQIAPAQITEVNP